MSLARSKDGWRILGVLSAFFWALYFTFVNHSLISFSPYLYQAVVDDPQRGIELTNRTWMIASAITGISCPLVLVGVWLATSMQANAIPRLTRVLFISLRASAVVFVVSRIAHTVQYPLIATEIGFRLFDDYPHARVAIAITTQVAWNLLGVLTLSYSAVRLREKGKTILAVASLASSAGLLISMLLNTAAWHFYWPILVNQFSSAPISMVLVMPLIHRALLYGVLGFLLYESFPWRPESEKVHQASAFDN